MVGQLKKFGSDPNGKGRGAGFYYHRGNGEYSKYSEKRDAKIRASYRKVANVKHAEQKEPHMGDYHKGMKRSHRIGKSRAKGYF